MSTGDSPTVGTTSDVTVERSEKRPGQVWMFFEEIRDVTNLNPAEEKEEAWEARIDGDVVGMAVVDTIPSTHAFVSRVAVVPDAREMGVGTALLEALQEEYGQLACRTRTDNDAGQALVESVGFTQVESRFHDLHRYETHPESE